MEVSFQKLLLHQLFDERNRRLDSVVKNRQVLDEMYCIRCASGTIQSVLDA